MGLPRIAVLAIDLDHFLLRLIRNANPDADVRVVSGDDRLLQELSRDPDVIIHSPSGLDGSQLADRELDARTIAIVDHRSAEARPTGAAQVLTRPVDMRTLRVAIARAAGRPAPLRDRVRTSLSELNLAWEPALVFGWLRLLMAALVLGIVALGASGRAVDGIDVPLAMAGVAVVHAAWRFWQRWLQAPHLFGDLAVAVAATVLIGGRPGPSAMLTLLAAIGLGYVGGRSARIGLAVAVASLAMPSGDGFMDPSIMVMLAVLFLSGSLLGAGVRQVRVERERRHRSALSDVHRALQDLHDHAQANPDRLHATSLRRDLVRTVADALGADRVALVCGPREQWHEPVVAGFPAPKVVADVDVPSRIAALPDHARVVRDRILLALVGGGGEVLVAPLRLDGILLGALIVGWDQPTRGARRRHRLEQLTEEATDAAVALDNADLFSALDRLSVAGERQRIARDLHDGIIQSFVHVGLELDRLADRLADVDLDAALAVMRLRHVVDDTVTDSRSVIRRLRNRDLDHGFRVAVEAYVQEHRSLDGPRTVLTYDLPVEPPAELATDLLLLLHEAVSNARQHAAASHITVEVRLVGDDLLMRVADDGDGIAVDLDAAGDPESLRGNGLPAMRQRAAAMGGRLDVGPGDDRGTVVTLVVPDVRASGLPEAARPISPRPRRGPEVSR